MSVGPMKLLVEWPPLLLVYYNYIKPLFFNYFHFSAGSNLSSSGSNTSILSFSKFPELRVDLVIHFGEFQVL